MEYNFDCIIDRQNTGSLKWDKYKSTDVIPMWVADMDFQCPAPILQALHQRVDHGIFGYTVARDELREVIVKRLQSKYGWEIEAHWIVWLPGLVPGLNVACRAVGRQGDEVLIWVPVYPPFLSAPRFSQRRLKTIPLCRQGDVFTFDMQGFRKAISAKSRLLLLCNPHNPVGRVYTKEELSALAQVCLEHNIIICSDEAHCDLIFDDRQHVPIATLSKEIEAQTITLMSPNKTFNLPGLNCGFGIISNDDLREQFQQVRKDMVPEGNALGFTACLASYKDCEPWRKALIDYLRKNRDIVSDYINGQVETLSMDRVEATYLAWINVEKLNEPDPAGFFERAGVGLSDGRHFGGRGHVRLNFGCPQQRLSEALDRMKCAVAKKKSI